MNLTHHSEDLIKKFNFYRDGIKTWDDSYSTMQINKVKCKTKEKASNDKKWNVNEYFKREKLNQILAFKKPNLESLRPVHLFASHWPKSWINKQHQLISGSQLRTMFQKLFSHTYTHTEYCHRFCTFISNKQIDNFFNRSIQLQNNKLDLEK